MGSKTGIAWTNATWNCIRGCTRVSEGCRHCYAEAVAARFSGPGLPYEGLATQVNGHPRWTNQVRFIPEHLADPLRWTAPRRIFVNSMSDLFHPDLPDAVIAQIFAIMAVCPHHTFQVLTKRPDLMAAFLLNPACRAAVRDTLSEWIANTASALPHTPIPGGDPAVAALNRALNRLGGSLTDSRSLRQTLDTLITWPLTNVWLGTSVEHQVAANHRIPHLLDTPAAIRFLSCEPLLGPVVLPHDWLAGPLIPADPGPDRAGPWWRRDQASGLHWVIIGGESGPDARVMKPEWADSLLVQCANHGIPAFFKQTGTVLARIWGCTDRKGETPEEWPPAFHVRQFPKSASLP